MGEDTEIPAEFKDMAARSRQAGIADENAELLGGGNDGGDAANQGVSSEEPAEGAEDAAPRQPGSPAG